MDLIFPRFGIDVQWKKKTPCPACGGRDRFRFDDNGNGDYFCQHCQGGDGLDLIGKCTHLSFPEIVKEVGAILGLDDSSKITDADREKWRKDVNTVKKEQRELEQKMCVKTLRVRQKVRSAMLIRVNSACT